MNIETTHINDLYPRVQLYKTLRFFFVPNITIIL